MATPIDGCTSRWSTYPSAATRPTCGAFIGRLYHTMRWGEPAGGTSPYRLSGQPHSRLVGSHSFRLRQRGARICKIIVRQPYSSHIFVRHLVRRRRRQLPSPIDLPPLLGHARPESGCRHKGCSLFRRTMIAKTAEAVRPLFDVSVPDALLPEQYFDRLAARTSDTPERRLLVRRAARCRHSAAASQYVGIGGSRALDP